MYLFDTNVISELRKKARANVDLNKIDTTKLVSKIDNQWSIVQSVFLLNTAKKSYHAIKIWGQIITGKYQTKINEIIEKEYLISVQ